jgi:hypothetical protein
VAGLGPTSAAWESCELTANVTRRRAAIEAGTPSWCATTGASTGATRTRARPTGWPGRPTSTPGREEAAPSAADLSDLAERTVASVAARRSTWTVWNVRAKAERLLRAEVTASAARTDQMSTQSLSLFTQPLLLPPWPRAGTWPFPATPPRIQLRILADKPVATRFLCPRCRAGLCNGCPLEDLLTCTVGARCDKVAENRAERR